MGWQFGLAYLFAFLAGLPWACSYVCCQLQVKALGDLGEATARRHEAKAQRPPLSKMLTDSANWKLEQS